MMNQAAVIPVEVAYATPEKQTIIRLNVMPGCVAYDAVMQSTIFQEFPEIDREQMEMGIFGQLEKDPKVRVLKAGDRVEIYRALIIDPKESRKARATKLKLEKEKIKKDKKMEQRQSKRVRTTDAPHFNS